MNSNTKLILASGSPRRSDLLREAGLSFEVLIPEIDETPRLQEVPSEYVCRTAREKAESLPASSAIMIAADTAVVNDGCILGKPKNEADAVAMLRALSGKTHLVMTGVCLRFPDRIDNFHVETAVTFRALTEREILDYVATGDPMDKAGSYAIQGGAAKMVRRIEGSYSNVVGLPLCEVIERLEAN